MTVPHVTDLLCLLPEAASAVVAVVEKKTHPLQLWQRPFMILLM